MQLMVVEFAREMLGMRTPIRPNSTRARRLPVIDLLPEQKNITDMGGTMRLGLYPCQLVPGSLAAKAYGVKQVQERHRHRFELNNDYRAASGSEGHALFRPVTGRPAGGDRRTQRIIPSCWAPSSTPNS